MEFYEIPCRSEGQGSRSFRAFGYARRARKGNREAALRARDWAIVAAGEAVRAA